MSTGEIAPAVDDSDEPRLRRKLTIGDILCGTGLVLGIVASYIYLVLTPRLLAHHGVLLEALSGSNAAIVTGGAFARVGRDSLFLVVLAPLATVLLNDVFYWWAGRRWGNSIAEFYTKNNPRAARWISRAERMMGKYGIWALMISYYLLPIPHVVIYLACGISGMPLGLFVLGDAVGLLLWEALLVGLGWAIGHPAVHAVNEIAHYSTRVTIGLVVLIVVVVAIRQRRTVRSKPPADPHADQHR